MDSVIDKSFSFGKKIDPLTLGASGDKTPQELLWGSERERWTKLDPDLQKSATAGRIAQRQALEKFTNLASDDPRGEVSARLEREKRGVTAGLGDTIRKLQEIRAQRGLGSSSVGLGQIRGATTEAAEKKGMLDASFGERLRNLRRQQAGDLMSASRNVLGTPGAATRQYFKTTKGLAPAIGGIVGGIFGGPAGAKVGAGAGQAGTEAFGPGSVQMM